jgi:hypothetical protein
MVVPNQHDRLPRILKTSKCSHFSLTTPHLASNSYDYVDVFANFLIVHVPSCVYDVKLHACSTNFAWSPGNYNRFHYHTINIPVSL